MLTASISIVVPPLPNVGIWFANSAAWSNYWKTVSGEIALDPAPTSVYAPIEFNEALEYCVLKIDGIDYQLVQKAQLDSLRARIDTLNSAFEDMRTQLKAAGLITEAQ